MTLSFISLVLAVILQTVSPSPVPSVSLAADPLTGSAPLEVTFVVSVEGPYTGHVCLAFEKVNEPGDVRVIGCEVADVPKDHTENYEHELSGGTSGEVYKFYAFLAEGDKPIVSEPVTITIE